MNMKKRMKAKIQNYLPYFYSNFLFNDNSEERTSTIEVILYA